MVAEIKKGVVKMKAVLKKKRAGAASVGAGASLPNHYASYNLVLNDGILTVSKKRSDDNDDLIREYKLRGSAVRKELTVLGGTECDIIIISIADSESTEKEIFLQIPLKEVNDWLVAIQAHTTHTTNEMPSGTIFANVSEEENLDLAQGNNKNASAKDESTDTPRKGRKAVPYVALVSVSMTALPKAPERRSARPSTIDVAIGAVLLSVKRKQIYAVRARYVNADQEVWLRIAEGWIPERLSMEQHNSTDKIFEVAKVGKRIDEVSIRYMKFNEKITKGKAVLKIFLYIDVVYDKNLVVTLCRSTAQFLSLKDAIGASQLKSVHAAKKITYFPTVKTGPQVLTNPFLLLDMQTGLEAWLKLLVPTIDVMKSGFVDYTEFVMPTLEDIEKIEIELTSSNGFRGGWSPGSDLGRVNEGDRSAGLAGSGNSSYHSDPSLALGRASHGVDTSNVSSGLDAQANRVGPLLKRGTVGGPFKRNRSVYAVVSDGLLSLYNSAESVGNEDAIGFIKLGKSKLVDTKDATIVILGVFEGKNNKEKDLHLTAAGSQEAESWRNSIRLNISSSKECARSGSAGAPTTRSSISVSASP